MLDTTDEEENASPGQEAPSPSWPIRIWRYTRGWIGFLVVLFFIKGCIIDQYTVPSDSMWPTLHGTGRLLADDRILVNKWIYGPRMPFTTWRLWKWGGPKRWDIVVFHAPDEESRHPTLVKRVAALPGERVHIHEGKLFINGEPVEPPEDMGCTPFYISTEKPSTTEAKRCFLQWCKQPRELLAPLLNPANDGVKVLLKDLDTWTPKLKNVTVAELSDEDVEKLCEGLSREAAGIAWQIVALYLRPQLQYGVLEEDTFAVVPEGCYFMLGDNSVDSADSRVWGWVPHDHLHGPAIALWWPWTRWRDFSGFSHTWWGKLILYGLPLLLVFLEVANHLRSRRHSKKAGSA